MNKIGRVLESSNQPEVERYKMCKISPRKVRGVGIDKRLQDPSQANAITDYNVNLFKMQLFNLRANVNKCLIKMN